MKRIYHLHVRRSNFGNSQYQFTSYDLPEQYDNLADAYNARKRIREEYAKEAIGPRIVGEETLYTGKKHYNSNYPGGYPEETYTFTIIAQDV